MKYYTYCEPVSESSSQPVYCILGEQAILDQYWDHWSLRVMENNRRRGLPIKQNVTHENCIQDWCAVHWATEVIPETLEALQYLINKD